MKWNVNGNILVAISVIFFGVQLIRYEGAYSWRNRLHVEFVASPYKEIVGVVCILWGVYFLYLVGKTGGPGTFRLHAPVWAATVMTLATFLVVKATGFGVFFMIGFPLLIVEFAVFYVVGLYVQKRLGWDATTDDSSPK